MSNAEIVKRVIEILDSINEKLDQLYQKHLIASKK